MLNELSCLKIDWTAIGSVATGMAAITGLGVWWQNIRRTKEHTHKRAFIYSILIMEEVGQASVCASTLIEEIENIHKHPIPDETFESIKSNLQPNLSTELLSVDNDLPFSTCGAAAQFVACTSSLRKTLILRQNWKSNTDNDEDLEKLAVLIHLKSKQLIEICEYFLHELEIRSKQKNINLKNMVIKPKYK